MRVFFPALQANHSQHLHSLFGTFLQRYAAYFQTIIGVFQNITVADKSEVLEHHGNLSAAQLLQLFAAEIGNVIALKVNCARGWWVKHIQATDKRGFAAAGKTDEDKYFAFVDGKIYINQTCGDAGGFLHLGAGCALLQHGHSFFLVLRMLQRNKQLVQVFLLVIRVQSFIFPPFSCQPDFASGGQ